MTIFKLPDLGEGLPDAEIVEWHVKVGDIMVLDQSLVSMETAKAVVEVPSPVVGRVIKLYGQPGDIIKTGSPLVEFEAETKENKEDKKDSGTVVGKLDQENMVIPAESQKKVTSKNTVSIKVTPAVRALAQRLKVDLETVTPSGPQGTITTEDVQKASHIRQDLGALEPLKGARRTMAHIMSQSHAEIVPVTVVDDAMLFAWSNDEDITVRIIKALIKACQQEPALNAWYDGKAIARRLLSEINLGLAMDSEEGLFVPVIHNVEKMDAASIRKKIDDYKMQMQNRMLTQEDFKQATIILSNFGKFAGKYANPIIVPPMVATLGVGRLREKILPLSLTVDHRVITGGEATRFLGVLIEELEKA